MTEEEGNDLKNMGLATFVVNNSIQMKECSSFISISEDMPCVCGGSAAEHGIKPEKHSKDKGVKNGRLPNDEQNLTEQNLIDWKRSNATKKSEIIEKPTENYGTLRFVSPRKKLLQCAEFLRASDSTDTKVLFDLMVNEWKIFHSRVFNPDDKEQHLEETDLVISILESQPSSLDDLQKIIIGNGCAKAVETTGGIILSSGQNAGASSLVSDYLTMSEEPGVNSRMCVGLTSWGEITDRHKLQKSKNPRYRAGKWGKGYLDGRQDFFLFVDNGFRNDHQTIQKATNHVKSQLELMLHKEKYTVINLLVGGKLDLLDSIVDRLKGGIQILCLQSSGGLADIFVDMKRTSSEKREAFLQQKLKGLSEELTTAYAFNPKISVILKKSSYINIFEADQDEMDVGFPLIQLYLDCKKKKFGKKVETWLTSKMILNWQWFGSANGQRSLIEMFDSISYSAKGKVLVKAFLEEKTELVRFILSSPYVFHNWNMTLRELLEDFFGYGSANSAFTPVQKKGCCGGCGGGSVDISIAKNLQFQVALMDEQPATVKISGLKEDFAGGRYLIWNNSVASKLLKKYGDVHIKYPAEELMRWAIFTRKHELALLSWEYTESPLISALGATCIYQLFLQNAHHSDMKKFNSSCKDDFETLALDMLASVYNKKEDIALRILKEGKHEAWENISVLSLAMQGGNKKFVAVPVVQELMWKIWVGREQLEKKYVRVEERCFGPVSPRFKFLCYYAMYFPFLLLYSYFTLFMMDHEGVPLGTRELVDFVIFLFVISILMRRIVDALISKFITHQKVVSLRSMSVTWFWYWFGMITAIIHTVGFCMRLAGWKLGDHRAKDVHHNTNIVNGVFTFPNKTQVPVVDLDLSKIGGHVISKFDDFVPWTKNLYCIAIFCFYLQLWELLVILPKLGPYIYLIGRMLSSFFSFMLILLILMTGYVVATQSLIFPQRPFEWQSVWELYYYPYFQLYGELFLTETTGDGHLDGCGEDVVKTGSYYCPKHSSLATFILGVYLLIGIILLVNLLIAVFSYQYESCYEEFDAIWKYQTAMSTLAWDEYTFFPPPLSLITNVFQLINIFRIVTERTGKYIINAGKVKVEDEKQEDDRLLLFEQRCLKLQLRTEKTKDLEKFLKNKRKKKKKTDFWKKEWKEKGRMVEDQEELRPLRPLREKSITVKGSKSSRPSSRATSAVPSVRTRSDSHSTQSTVTEGAQESPKSRRSKSRSRSKSAKSRQSNDK